MAIVPNCRLVSWVRDRIPKTAVAAKSCSNSERTGLAQAPRSSFAAATQGTGAPARARRPEAPTSALKPCQVYRWTEIVLFIWIEYELGLSFHGHDLVQSLRGRRCGLCSPWVVSVPLTKCDFSKPLLCRSSFSRQRSTPCRCPFQPPYM